MAQMPLNLSLLTFTLGSLQPPFRNSFHSCHKNSLIGFIPGGGGIDCQVILMGGFFTLKFSTYGSVFNLNSGRWVAFSEFLSQLNKSE